jgi:hypothetical protein
MHQGATSALCIQIRNIWFENISCIFGCIINFVYFRISIFHHSNKGDTIPRLAVGLIYSFVLNKSLTMAPHAETCRGLIRTSECILLSAQFRLCINYKHMYGIKKQSIKALCGHKVEFLNVKLDGLQRNYQAVYG